MAVNMLLVGSTRLTVIKMRKMEKQLFTLLLLTFLLPPKHALHLHAWVLFLLSVCHPWLPRSLAHSLHTKATPLIYMCQSKTQQDFRAAQCNSIYPLLGCVSHHSPCLLIKFLALRLMPIQWNRDAAAIAQRDQSMVMSCSMYDFDKQCLWSSTLRLSYT